MDSGEILDIHPVIDDIDFLDPEQLPGEVRIVGRAVGEEFEDGVGAEGVVVVRVRVPGQDAEDAGPHHLRDGVVDEVGGRIIFLDSEIRDPVRRRFGISTIEAATTDGARTRSCTRCANGWT